MHRTADWMSARAWPACQYHSTPEGEKIVIMGGDMRALTTVPSVAATPSAIALTLAPSLSNAELTLAAEVDLRARLKRISTGEQVGQ